jgi:hypothetical protein
MEVAVFSFFDVSRSIFILFRYAAKVFIIRERLLEQVDIIL